MTSGRRLVSAAALLVLGSLAMAAPIAVPAAPLSESPALALAVNGGRETTALRGWPLVFQLQVLHPDPVPRRRGERKKGTRLVVKGGKEGWLAALSIAVRDDAGAPQRWALLPAFAPARSLVLKPGTVRELRWWLVPEESAQLGPGRYTVVAVLDTAAAARGWRGRVHSQPATVIVEEPPSVLTSAQEEAAAHLLAGYALSRGDADGAAGIADAFLAVQPRNPAALALRADLLALRGETRAALTLYDRAVGEFYTEFPDAQEPPVSILAARHALRTRLLQRRR